MSSHDDFIFFPFQTLMKYLGPLFNRQVSFYDRWNPNQYEVTILDPFAGAGVFGNQVQTLEIDNDLNFGSPVIAVTTANAIISGRSKRARNDRGDDPTNRAPLRVAHFFFCDKNPNHVESLKKVVKERMELMGFRLVDRRNEDVLFYHKTFGGDTAEFKIQYWTGEFQNLNLSNVPGPMFSFIDPYGYSAIPMRQIKHLIGENKVAFINLNVSAVYRFRNVHQDHVTALFGEEEILGDIDPDWTPNEKMRSVMEKYKQKIKEEFPDSVSAAMAFRRGKSAPDKATIYYKVFATKSLQLLNGTKTHMIQHIQDAGLWGELAFTDYYHHQGIAIEYGRKTSAQFEAAVIYAMLQGQELKLGEVKAKILEETEFPYHTLALRALEKAGKIVVFPLSKPGKPVKRGNKSLCAKVSHRIDNNRSEYGNYWKIQFLKPEEVEEPKPKKRARRGKRSEASSAINGTSKSGSPGGRRIQKS